MERLYNRIEELCKANKISITEMCKQAGVSRSIMTELKKGRTNSLSQSTLEKISEYFNVKIDDLLGKNESNTTTSKIGMDDFTYAFYNEAKELTEENKQKLLELARFFKEQQEKEN